MTIVNCTVVNQQSHRTLLKWKIVKCETESTVEQFFTVVCQIHLEMDPNSLVLEAAFVGKSKETLDPTACDIDLGEVICIFGFFLKYQVSTDKQPSTSPVSAFTIIMAAQKELSRERLPDRLEKDSLTRKESFIMM